MKFVRYSLRLSAVLFCVFLSGCQWPWSAEEKKAASKLVIVDVNIPELYGAAHIKGALHVPVTDLDAKAKDWNKEDTYVFYCSGPLCTDSETAANKLVALGFKNASHFKGGIAVWHKLFDNDPKLVEFNKESFDKLTEPLKKAFDVEMTDALKAEAEELKTKIEKAAAPAAEVKVEEVKVEPAAEVKTEAAPAAEVKPEAKPEMKPEAAPAAQKPAEPAPAPLADVK